MSKNLSFLLLVSLIILGILLFSKQEVCFENTIEDTSFDLSSLNENIEIHVEKVADSKITSKLRVDSFGESIYIDSFGNEKSFNMSWPNVLSVYSSLAKSHWHLELNNIFKQCIKINSDFFNITLSAGGRFELWIIPSTDKDGFANINDTINRAIFSPNNNFLDEYTLTWELHIVSKNNTKIHLSREKINPVINCKECDCSINEYYVKERVDPCVHSYCAFTMGGNSLLPDYHICDLIIDEKDLNGCDKLTFEFSKDLCKLGVASSTQNLTVCNFIKDKDLKVLCSGGK